MGNNFNYTFNSKLGKTAFGGEFRNESIINNVLGENLDDTIVVKGESNTFYTKGKSRQHISLFLEQVFTLKKHTASAGIMAYWNSNFDWKAFP